MKTDRLMFASASALFLLLAGCSTHRDYATGSSYGSGTSPTYYSSSTTHGGQAMAAPTYGPSDTAPPVPTTQSLSDADNSLVYRINKALTKDSYTRTFAPNIHAYSQNGAVTLTGTVPTDSDRQAVDNIVRRITGVSSVRDEMQVTPASASASMPTPSTASGLTPTGSDQSRLYPTDTGNFFNLQVESLNDTDKNMAQRILQGMRTDNAIAMSFPHVTIDVSNGRVTLRGTVQTNQQRRAIVAAVQQAAGFNNVFDELQVTGQ